jgi:hypothetical protein
MGLWGNEGIFGEGNLEIIYDNYYNFRNVYYSFFEKWRLVRFLLKLQIKFYFHPVIGHNQKPILIDKSIIALKVEPQNGIIKLQSLRNLLALNNSKIIAGEVQMHQSLIKLQHVTESAYLPANVILTDVKHFQTPVGLQPVEQHLGTPGTDQVPVQVQFMQVGFRFQQFGKQGAGQIREVVDGQVQKGQSTVF